ncbi:MAG: cysteine--tRNA ligase [Bacteroidales bacterium]|nr:cysteine--tRNA ligase [Bacteroidales bacterium]
MENKLEIYNTLSRKKELFKPLINGFVGMYVCGPTVYGDAHLGHARPAITFDVIYRYLSFIGYKVRYVRNITDVGHLENDADEGEDKIIKKARLEQLEPMEIAQYYTKCYLDAMDALNVLRPNIQPVASGHIIEQIEIVQQIIDAGYAYVNNGSVYFDVHKYQKDTGKYGILSNRVIEDMKQGTRELDGQSEKRNPADFALWKKAAPEHIMHWSSPWSIGFPGWHLECTAMSRKYLGEEFDIHGGGIDLLFPHHESEIAQSVCSCGKEPAKYWIHNNMITINGQKMGKSLGNFITLEEIFTGKNANLNQAYSPMTIRFFILQAHYRSTLNFSNEALQASEKGLKKLFEACRNLDNIKTGKTSTISFNIMNETLEAMNDDFNTPVVIAHLFETVHLINLLLEGKETITLNDLENLKHDMLIIIKQILGLSEETNEDKKEIIDGLVTMILDLRAEARAEKNWVKSDFFRDKLLELGITIKDGKEGATWLIE